MDLVALAKVLTWLSYPMGLATLLAVFATLMRIRRRHRLCLLSAMASVLVLFVCSNPIFATWLTRTLEARSNQLKTRDYSRHDAIIVLGGGMKLPLRPSTRPQLGAAGDRYWYAAELYLAGKADYVFLAGGNVYPQMTLDGVEMPGEAHFVANIINRWGVPESAIVLESRSRTTTENKRFISQKLIEHDIHSALLVTSAIHMPRSMMNFDDLDLELTPAPADFLAQESHGPAIFNWIPSAYALQLTTQSLHEYYGMTVLYVSRELNALMGNG